MNKKILIIFSLLFLLLLFFIIFINFILKDNKINNLNLNDSQIENLNDSQIEKYKNLGYEIIDNNIIFCNQSMNCVYDVFKSCTRSNFLMFSKTDNTGYIISSLGFVESVCNISIVNGSNHKDIKNCFIDKIYLNDKFIDNFLENKKYLEFCK